MTTPPRIALLTSITSIVSAVMLAFPASTYAASIIWGAPTGISGDTDVSTTGTLAGAFNIGGPGVATTTVNGVTFTGLAVSGTSVTSGNFNLSIPTGFSNSNTFGSASAPFSGLSAPYQALLSSGAGDDTTSFTLTMSALGIGQAYQFQWWCNISVLTTNFTTTATAGTAVTLGTNPSATDGGLGQFATGIFVADAPTEVITFSATTNSVLDGFQLRVVPVPEPSTWAMLAIGGASILAFRRRSPRSA
jgi:PEP-CTERM motif